MKLHSFRQDLQGYQDFFCLVRLYPVHPVDPVRKIKLYFVKFFIRLNWSLFRPAAGLNPEPLNLWTLNLDGFVKSLKIANIQFSQPVISMGYEINFCKIWLFTRLSYFRDTKISMNILEKLTHEQNFKKDRVKSKKMWPEIMAK